MSKEDEKDKDKKKKPKQARSLGQAPSFSKEDMITVGYATPRGGHSAQKQSFRQSSDEPSIQEFMVIQELTLALIKHGDYAVRFIERLEEEARPTLMVSVKLPRGTQAGDSEVFGLHEIAQSISNKHGIEVIVSTSNVSWNGKRLKYDPGIVARTIGANVLFGLPNFYACETQLKIAMEMLSADKNYADILDVMENLNILARIYFYMGRHKEAFLVLEKMETILDLMIRQVEEKAFDYIYVYPEFNSTALLYAMFGEFEKAFTLVDRNFDFLKNYVEKHDLIRRKDDPEDQEAYAFYASLPEDITFARQDVREKILFYKDKSSSSMSDCESTLNLVDEPLKRFLMQPGNA